MPEELCNVKAGLVRRTPTTQFLVRKCLWARNSPEEIHPPLCSLCMSTIDVEQSQRNLNLADPFLRTLVQLRLCLEAITFWVCDEEMIKWRSFLSILGRIVDECLVGYIVGIDLVLEIRLRVVGTLVDERFDNFVGPDIIVRAL